MNRRPPLWRLLVATPFAALFGLSVRGLDWALGTDREVDSLDARVAAWRALLADEDDDDATGERAAP